MVPTLLQRVKDFLACAKLALTQPVVDDLPCIQLWHILTLLPATLFVMTCAAR